MKYKHKTMVVQKKEKQRETKLKELNQWKSESVSDEVPDQDQDCISLTWVIQEKLVEN